MNFIYSDKETSKRREITVNGKLKVFNTINEFNQLDKNKLLDELGAEIWSDITSGKSLEDPDSLTRFCLITFAVKIV